MKGLSFLAGVLSCISVVVAQTLSTTIISASATRTLATASVHVSGAPPSTASASPATTTRKGPTFNGSNGGYGTPSANGGNDGPDTSSFSLPRGALIAIIVIVVFVAIFGILSAVLYFVAKKRQWEIRASIRRASRRMTGRDRRQSNRNGSIRMQSPSRKSTRDVEKGLERNDLNRSRATVDPKGQQQKIGKSKLSNLVSMNK